jgi:hypothetical protein
MSDNLSKNHEILTELRDDLTKVRHKITLARLDLYGGDDKDTLRDVEGSLTLSIVSLYCAINKLN